MVIFSDLLPIGNPKFLAGNFQPIERRYLYTSVFVLLISRRIYGRFGTKPSQQQDDDQLRHNSETFSGTLHLYCLKPENTIISII